MKYIISIVFLLTFTNIFYAAAGNDIENLKIEISNISCQDCLHRILKNACSQIENVNFIEFLLSKIENINTNDQDITALHIAAVHNSLDVVKLLVEKGANVNAKTLCKATPAHMAARNDKLNTVLFLKKNGADMTAEDFTGFKVDTYLKEQ